MLYAYLNVSQRPRQRPRTRMTRSPRRYPRQNRPALSRRDAARTVDRRVPATRLHQRARASR